MHVDAGVRWLSAAQARRLERVRDVTGDATT
jgi:hypothetical protein